MVKVLTIVSRVLAILLIVLISLFSLDVFSMEKPLLEKIAGFLIHNIPVYLLIIALIIGWKHEIAGGVAFFILAIAAYIAFAPKGIMVSILVAAVSIVFIATGVLKRRTL